MTKPPSITKRLSSLGWAQLAAQLDERGYATTGNLLTSDECRALSGRYSEESRFRKRIVMSRHGYGEGEYQYFTYPLPRIVAEIRTAAYPRLAPIGNRWREQLELGAPMPLDLEDYLKVCHAAGQTRPTPLLLKYAAGGYNRLHQDLYGELHFPLQMTILLSEPGGDFEGGEFILTEQRPRMQSRAQVVPLRQGEAVIFAVNVRPGQGQRGFHRLTMRHGVSQIRSGSRMCLGVIFHDAK